MYIYYAYLLKWAAQHQNPVGNFLNVEGFHIDDFSICQFDNVVREDIGDFKAGTGQKFRFEPSFCLPSRTNLQNRCIRNVQRSVKLHRLLLPLGSGGIQESVLPPPTSFPGIGRWYPGNFVASPLTCAIPEKSAVIDVHYYLHCAIWKIIISHNDASRILENI